MSFSSIQTWLFSIVLIAFLTTGCEPVRYYGQAICGQVAILNKRRPIDQLLADPQTPTQLKEKLERVLHIRAFAQNELNLPVKKNYLSFVALDRPYVIWNVYAAPAFSLKPKTWCFPVVGCTAYRGYFDEQNARDYAEKLKTHDFDVHIGGVTAYSTLGWFDDPVLSTVIDYSEADLAALIFHELAHQILYVDDDTTFNESFATTVEQEGLRRFSLATNHAGQYDDYLKSRRRRRAFTALIMKYRKKLGSLYEEDLPVAVKRRRKEAIIEALRNEYQNMKKQWEGYSGYDNWFRKPINNAKLNTVATYHELVPAFFDLLERERGDLKRFYATCRQLAEKPKAQRLRELRGQP